MNQEAISAIFSGLSVLITAIGGIVVLRRRQQEDEDRQDQAELKYLRKENLGLKSYNLAATRHMYRLELLLAGRDIDPPPRPTELATDPDIPDRPIRDFHSGTFPQITNANRPEPPSGASGRVIEGTLLDSGEDKLD